MIRLFAILLLCSFFIAANDCGGQDPRATTPATPVVPSAALPTDLKGLQEELKNVRARESLLRIAIADAKDEAAQARLEAVQIKLWIGSGACFLAALVLVGLGIWTTRRILVEVGIAAAGLGGLLIVAAWLVPYALWIGIGVVVIIAGLVTYMLVNRERALHQVTAAVDALKPQLPGYRDHFRQHIDTGADRLLNHIRRNRPQGN